MENPIDPEQPKEKRTLLELAAELRVSAQHARQEVESYQALVREKVLDKSAGGIPR